MFEYNLVLYFHTGHLVSQLVQQLTYQLSTEEPGVIEWFLSNRHPQSWAVLEHALILCRIVYQVEKVKLFERVELADKDRLW